MDSFKYGYAYEKFYAVLRELATGRNDARWRIWYAHYAAGFSRLKEEHIPPDLQERWKKLWKILWKILWKYLKGFDKVVPDTGHLNEPPNPFKRMKNSTAQKIAIEMFEMGMDVVKRFEIEMYKLNQK